MYYLQAAADECQLSPCVEAAYSPTWKQSIVLLNGADSKACFSHTETAKKNLKICQFKGGVFKKMLFLSLTPSSSYTDSHLLQGSVPLNPWEVLPPLKKTCIIPLRQAFHQLNTYFQAGSHDVMEMQIPEHSADMLGQTVSSRASTFV